MATEPRGLGAELKTFHYMMEPGDCTKYVFALTFPVHYGSFATHNMKIHIKEAADQILQVQQGFVLISILMPHWQGAYPSAFSALKHLDGGHVHYLAGHMNAAGHSSRVYTIAAVCLAASVLIDDPLAIEAACTSMLKVSDILK